MSDTPKFPGHLTAKEKERAINAFGDWAERTALKYAAEREKRKLGSYYRKKEKVGDTVR